MSAQCLNCNKPLPKGVQSTFCSRACWKAYKDRKGMGVDPERQATIMIKDSSTSLITSLKSEIQKKDEIIRHQDKLIQEYRDSLEIREKDFLKLQAKLRYYEGLVTELRQQSGKPATSSISSATSEAVEKSSEIKKQTKSDQKQQNERKVTEKPVLSDFGNQTQDTSSSVPSSEPQKKQTLWQRLRKHFGFNNPQS